MWLAHCAKHLNDEFIESVEDAITEELSTHAQIGNILFI